VIRRMMRTKVATETAWSLAHEGLSLVSMLAAFLLLARHLGTDGYGSYVGLYGLLAPFAAFTLSGVNLTVLEHLVREREDPATVAASCTAVAVLLGAALSVVVLALDVVLLEGIDLATTALLVLAELVVNSSSYALVAVIQARQGFIPSIKVRLVGIVVRLAGLFVLAATDNMTLGKLAIVYFTSFACYTAWVGSVVRRNGHGGLRVGRPERRHVASAFLYGLGISAVNVQNDGDKVALNSYGLREQAGIYGAAYRIVQLGLLPISALAGSTHMSFLHIDEHDNDQVARAKKLGAVSLAYALVFGVCLVAVSPLLPHVLGDSFADAADVIPWLVPLVLLRGPGTFAMNGLLGLGRNRLRTGILLANAVWSVVLYATLIPAHGWKGAAVATVVGEATMFVAGWVALVVAQRRYDLDRADERANAPEADREPEVAR
jgi:O-antigen/teichoic acid export membrane protein